jgi:hypothetical protein
LQSALTLQDRPTEAGGDVNAKVQVPGPNPMSGQGLNAEIGFPAPSLKSHAGVG